MPSACSSLATASEGTVWGVTSGIVTVRPMSSLTTPDTPFQDLVGDGDEVENHLPVHDRDHGGIALEDIDRLLVREPVDLGPQAGELLARDHLLDLVLDEPSTDEVIGPARKTRRSARSWSTLSRRPCTSRAWNTWVVIVRARYSWTAGSSASGPTVAT